MTLMLRFSSGAWKGLRWIEHSMRPSKRGLLPNSVNWWRVSHSLQSDSRRTKDLIYELTYPTLFRNLMTEIRARTERR